MREIKFRAFHEKSEEIFYLSLEKLISGYYTHAFTHELVAESGGNVLDRYTGLKDKEGADLYEDDVCNVEGLGLCVVAICPMYGAIFKTKDNQEAPLIDCDAESDLYEKVGNIHQNPELLK